MANAQELDKMRRLEEELKKGNAEEASKIIEEIILNAGNGTDAKPKTVDKPSNEVNTKKLRVSIGLENWQVNNQTRIHLFFEPTATIGDIRKTLHERYGIQSELQIIFQDQRVLEDKQTLAEVGVVQDGQGLIVYVRQQIHDKEEQVFDDTEVHFAREDGAKGNEFQKPVLSTARTQPTFNRHVEPTVLEPPTTTRSTTARTQPVFCGHVEPTVLEPPTTARSHASTSKPQPSSLFAVKTLPVLKKTSAVNPGQELKTHKVKQNVFQERPASPVNPGWQCNDCTYINLPYRPGCELCSSARPEDYRIPENYAATDAERAWCDQVQDVDPGIAFLQENAVKPLHIAQELLAADDTPLLYSDEQFDCKICFTTVEVGDGARLRNCLHEFCVDCLRGHIQACQDAVVKCPFADDKYKCDEIIDDREIRELVDQEAFEKYKQRGLKQAEAAAPNSFHCQTANCEGWCIVEENANFFRCDLCKANNCLLCKAIHTGMNCKQYQDDLRIRSANDLAAQATQDLLDREIRDGNAMRCPQCNIIVQKKVGCDWLQCSMCKCEICWVTKGPRWGPKGNGDTTGGCRCRVGGKLCSPVCGNCH